MLSSYLLYGHSVVLVWHSKCGRMLSKKYSLFPEKKGMELKIKFTRHGEATQKKREPTTSRGRIAASSLSSESRSRAIPNSGLKLLLGRVLARSCRKKKLSTFSVRT